MIQIPLTRIRLVYTLAVPEQILSLELLAQPEDTAGETIHPAFAPGSASAGVLILGFLSSH